MELDDIKTAWASLDERLNKQGSIKESILRELICSKGNKSLNRLLNYEWLGLIFVVLAIPIIPFIMHIASDAFNTVSTVILLLFEVFVLFGLGAQIWKIRTLGKISYSEKVKDNVESLNKYNLFVKKEKILVVVVFVLLVIFFISRKYFDGFKIDITHAVQYFTLIAIGLVLCIWQYKRMYLKNIDSVRKSLDELKELEDE